MVGSGSCFEAFEDVTIMESYERTELVKRIAMYRDMIGKKDPELGSVISSILMLLINDYYELRDLIEEGVKKVNG